MTNRKQFEMTEEQLTTLMDACRPVAMIMLQCGTPSSPQQNANAAWASLGTEMGFKPMTVQPSGGNNRVFTAIPIGGSPNE
jgi:hypothetical protein